MGVSGIEGIQNAVQPSIETTYDYDPARRKSPKVNKKYSIYEPSKFLPSYDGIVAEEEITGVFFQWLDASEKKEGRSLRYKRK